MTFAATLLAIKQASKQASMQASKQASKQANKRTIVFCGGVAAACFSSSFLRFPASKRRAFSKARRLSFTAGARARQTRLAAASGSPVFPEFLDRNHHDSVFQSRKTTAIGSVSKRVFRTTRSIIFAPMRFPFERAELPRHAARAMTAQSNQRDTPKNDQNSDTSDLSRRPIDRGLV
jgi:hypothetical protein